MARHSLLSNVEQPRPYKEGIRFNVLNRPSGLIAGSVNCWPGPPGPIERAPPRAQVEIGQKARTGLPLKQQAGCRTSERYNSGPVRISEPPWSPEAPVGSYVSQAGRPACRGGRKPSRCALRRKTMLVEANLKLFPSYFLGCFAAAVAGLQRRNSEQPQ